MRTEAPPPPHATHGTGIFEDLFAKASAQIALVQVKNALKALTPGQPCPISAELVIANAEANLDIIERALQGKLQ